MTGRNDNHGRLLRVARRAARAIVSAPMWRVVDDELHEELQDRADRGWGRWRCEVWGAWQYLSVSVSVLLERSASGLRDARRGHASMRGGWLLDLRQAARGLKSRPLTTLSVVVTIALAVGATTSVYTVVEGVLLRPLPYPESDRLVRLWQTRAAWAESSEAEFRSDANRLTPLAPSYYDWLGVDMGFETLGAWVDAAFVLQHAGGATALRGQEASSGLFEALRIQPIVGRTLDPGDDTEDATPVVVVGEAFWRDYFGGDAAALGSDLVLNGVPHIVVGVMPGGFMAPTSSFAGSRSLPGQEPTMWVPLTAEARRGWKNVSVLGRLAPGVALETASDRLTTSQDAMTPIYPDYQGAWAESLLDSVVGDVRSTLWFLLGAVGLVLVVATVNIANVLGAAGLSRRRELAMRAALGAGSGRLARGLVVESAMLAVLGGSGGIALAWVSLPLLMSYVPPTLPRHDTISMSVGVLLFGLAISAITALLTGVLPALSASRANPQDALRASAGSGGGGPAARVMRSGLVVTELSLAFVLLVGAGLLGNSYLRLWAMERGFATDGLVAMWVVPDRASYGSQEERDEFVRAVASGISELPGASATVANNLPLSGMRAGTEFYVERPDARLDVLDNGILMVVLDNYFDVLGIPIVEGRAFRRDDDPDAPLVGIVGQEMARRYWPGRSAIGQRLRTYDDSTASVEIVGVAGDVRHQGLATAAEPTVYLPASQSNRSTNEVILRVQGDVGEAVRSARDVVSGLSSTTPVRRVLVLEQAISDSVAIPRFRTALILGLAGLAAVLALLGVYGVVAYTVAQSRREIGVRMALGAHTRKEVRRVLGRGLKLGLGGVVFGLLIAWTAADVLRGFLFDISPTDPMTYLAVVVVVLGVTALAAFVPAMRAATVHPAAVLKSE